MRVEEFISPNTKKQRTVIFDKDTGLPETGWDEKREHPIEANRSGGLNKVWYDDSTFSMLPKEVQQVCLWWVWLRTEIRATPNAEQTSYGLKHILEDEIGVYMTNNQFKDMMLHAGYRPASFEQLNWRFCIKTVKSKGQCPSEFRYIHNHLTEILSKQRE